MASYTAQILVGSPHPYHGGINPTHYLFLSENDRPAWLLYPYRNTKEKQITWIPTLDSMLEDAFLMISIFILKDKEIVRIFKESTCKIPSKNQRYKDITIDKRFFLYEKCKELKSEKRIIFTVLKESTLMNNLRVIKEYNLNVTLCVEE